MTKSTIFSPADILLPDYEPHSPRWTEWASIACDQFTSEPEYWEAVEKTVGDCPSTYRLFLPEAYLGTEREKTSKRSIRQEMDRCIGSLKKYPDALIYLERTLPDGSVRRGLIGKLDLEAYDYSVRSSSPVRATEATVLERIPARQAIRAEASLELPHIMILVDDPEGRWLAPMQNSGASASVLYDFELMQGGGHVKGFLPFGSTMEALKKAVETYEDQPEGSVLYAMGDGNHSLAAAKSHYETLKARLGDKALSHPARFALCEIVPLQEPSLVFEPIYRLLKQADPADFRNELEKVAGKGDGTQSFTLLWNGKEENFHFLSPEHALTVGSLQMFLDRFTASHKGCVCDYIHDESSLRKLAAQNGNVGFLFDGMPKEELFPYVSAWGTLPRKTFSMGEARSKRYYLETRKITEEER